MTLRLNGEDVDIHDAESVHDLIEHLQIHPATVLVEHNGVALHRREWLERQLGQGDRIELVRVVAGG